MSTDKKISTLINSQVPFFVRNDHPNFVRFLELYFEYLEQEGNVVKVAKDNVPTIRDVDLTLYEDQLYSEFMKFIPKDVVVDKHLLMKNIKDFYRAKGTERSVKFLMNILFGEDEVQFYYPKKDVLRASDGKWFVQKSLRLSDTFVNGQANTNIFAINNFTGKAIRGNTSNATASVERVDRFFEKGTQVDELIITNILGNFVNGEQVFATFNDDGVTKTITANVFGGVLNTVSLTNAGAGYNVGDLAIIESDSGFGANVRVDRVSSGVLSSITVIEGGAGYQSNVFALFSGGGSGTGANAEVTLVQSDGSVHPNSYNIVSSTISPVASTLINAATYPTLNSANVNTTLQNAFTTFVYANTGPARIITVRNTGSRYTSVPSVSLLANTRVKELQILGRMKIVEGGLNYQVNDVVSFVNVPGGYGSGANAIVSSVNANGAITGVSFVPVPGHTTGGSGYNLLPSTVVLSSTGSGANIIVTDRLAEGGEFIVANTSLGSIESLQITERGSGYTEVPTINLSSKGDGTALVDATILEGVFTYPGRYLNDDGQLSSYNFIQDRDYYQNFSYVLILKQSIANYRKAVKQLVHPSGMKLFGQYVYVDEQQSQQVEATGHDTLKLKSTQHTYIKTGNTINVAYTSHGLSANDLVYLEVLTGNTQNIVSGVYSVDTVSTNFFEVKARKSGVETIAIANESAGYTSNGYLVFSEEDGKKANGTYTIDANGSIVSAEITDYGFFYNTTPTVYANGSNSNSATFIVSLSNYPVSNTSGNVNVTVYLV